MLVTLPKNLVQLLLVKLVVEHNDVAAAFVETVGTVETVDAVDHCLSA